MRSWRSDLFMWWQNLIIGLVEGENDGLVTAASARWTGFQGIWRGADGRGVSHMDEVDFRRRPLRRRGDCLLYTSDAADDLLCVDSGGRRIIYKKKKTQHHTHQA